MYFLSTAENPEKKRVSSVFYIFENRLFARSPLRLSNFLFKSFLRFLCVLGGFLKP